MTAGAGWAAIAFTDRLLIRISALLGGLSVAAILVLIVGGVVGRTFFDEPLLPHYVEYSGYLMVLLIYAGAAHSHSSGTFVRMDLLANQASGAVKRLLAGVNLMLTVAVFGLLTYFTWDLTLENQQQGVTAFGASGISLYVPQLGMSVGLSMLSLHLLIRLFAEAAGQDLGGSPSQR